MRYSFLAVIVLCLAMIGLPVQGALPYRADSISPTAAAPGISSVPLPPRAIARLGSGLINAIEISPDSKLIAVGSSVGVTVYEAATLKALWSARGAARIMKWSPDSALLAADISGVSVWDAATGRLAYKLKNSFPNDLKWSPDSRRLVMASGYGLGMIWYLKAGTLPINLVVRGCDPDAGMCSYPIIDMHAALSPDGRLYATTYGHWGGDGLQPAQGVVIWDALNGAQKRVLPTSGNQLKWLHDNTHLLVGPGDEEWDAKTGQQVDITSPSTPEGSFSLPSGELVAWEYADSATPPRLVDVNTNTSLCDSGLVSPDFKLCVNQEANAPDVVFSQIGSGTEVRRIEDISEIAAFSPDWNFLVGWSASSPNNLNVWKAADGQMIGKLAQRSQPLNGVAWSPDGRRLALADQVGNVQLWGAVTDQFVQTLPNPSATSGFPGLIRAAFSPDGSRLAVSGINGKTLVIWDMATAQLVAQTDIDGSAGMVWSPVGTEIALVSYQQQVLVVDAATGNVQRSTEAEASADGEYYGEVAGIGWSPDGKQIAVGSCGGAII